MKRFKLLIGRLQSFLDLKLTVSVLPRTEAQIVRFRVSYRSKYGDFTQMPSTCFEIRKNGTR
jgi:hypothetical protein